MRGDFWIAVTESFQCSDIHSLSQDQLADRRQDHKDRNKKKDYREHIDHGLALGNLVFKQSERLGSVHIQNEKQVVLVAIMVVDRLPCICNIAGFDKRLVCVCIEKRQQTLVLCDAYINGTN